MDIIGHLPIDLYSSKYTYRVAMTSEEHGLKKYKLVNALTMDNPLSLVEKINSAHTFQRLSSINSLKLRSSVLSLFVCSILSEFRSE